MVSLIGPPVNEKIAVKPHRPGVGGEHDPEAITQGRAGGGGVMGNRAALCSACDGGSMNACGARSNQENWTSSPVRVHFTV